ncbi:MAG: lipopolysaccharide heptosyltransferase I [Acidobacteria bacterium]|nr:lipopolysaccharide heptosyltransferase I [Acidobacteriota bacterium]
MSGPRILIVRTSAMGDIVHALPVLNRLRQSLPDAHIGWVVEQVFAPLLEGHPDLDAVIPIGLRTWRQGPLSRRAWRELRAFFKALNDFSPDTVLDLMGSHKAGLIGACTLADRRLGLAPRDRREPSSAIWLSETAPARGTHAVDHMLSVLEAGQLVPSSDARASFGGRKLHAEPWVQGPEEGDAFALLHPRTAWSSKDYPLESWRQVVRSIKQESGLETWVAWGPGEESTAHKIAQRAGGRVLEQLQTIPQLVALSRAARIVLGGDTGPLHLAHALGTPVVCVMGPTDPERNGPYQAPGSAVVHRLPCSFCYQRLDEAKPCLLNISPERVVDKALELLG